MRPDAVSSPSQLNHKSTMKSATLISLCVMMSLGMALAAYGSYGYTSYVPVHPGSGSGDGSFLMLIGLLFILMILFTNNSFFNRTATSTSGSNVYVIGG